MLGNGSYTRSWAGAEANRDGIRPRFYMEAIQDELGSAKAGRPIFREEERVELFMPGNPWTIPVERVNDDHRARWPREYEAFKRGLDVALEGTPIEEWPILNRAQVRELKAMEIHTVEDIATLTDLATQRFMGGMGLRTKARAFLDDAAAMSLVEQLTKENDDLKIRLATLENQVKELGEIGQRQHAQLMGMQNAPHPLATMIPGLADPMQIHMQQAGVAARPEPQSSLAAFDEAEGQRRGRPQRHPLPIKREE